MHGIAYPIQNVASYFSVKVVQKVDLGTHVMFIGEVEDAEVLAEKEVMTYAYYHQVKNGTTPKNAPSFQEKTEKSGWRCSICGYIYEGDPLPEDAVRAIMLIRINSLLKGYSGIRLSTVEKLLELLNKESLLISLKKALSELLETLLLFLIWFYQCWALDVPTTKENFSVVKKP